jgi:hypothetical protein
MMHLPFNVQDPAGYPATNTDGNDLVLGLAVATDQFSQTIMDKAASPSACYIIAAIAQRCRCSLRIEAFASHPPR